MPLQKQKRHKRLADILCVMVAFIAIAGIIVLSVEFRVSVKNLHTEHFQESVMFHAEHKLLDINHFINEMVEQLEYVALKVNQQDTFESEEVKESLKGANSAKKFDYIGVVDATGKGYDDHNNIVDIAERDYFKQAMEGKVSFSEVIDSKVVKGKKVQIIAQPIRTLENDVIGVVYGVVNIDDLGNKYPHKDYGYDDTVAIVDSCGDYIFQYRGEKNEITDRTFWSDLEGVTLEDRTIEELKADWKAEKQGMFTVTANGQQRLACYMPIGPNKWQLVYSTSVNDMDEIVQEVYGVKAKNTWMTVACHILLLACVVWYFKRANKEICIAQQDAQRNMEFMRIAIEYSDHTVFEYNQMDRTVQLKTNLKNKRFAQDVIEFVPESIIQENIIEPDSIPAFEQLFVDIQREKSAQVDIQCNEKLQKIWYRISLKNIYNDHGMIIDTVGIVEDITEQKKKEFAIKRKLQIQETLIAKALMCAKFNLHTDTLLELNGNEMQMPFQAFLHDQIYYKVDDAHIPYVEQALSIEALDEAYQQGKESVEVQYVMKREPENIWVSCVVYRISADDNATMLMVITDIDAKKRREIALKKQAERDGLTGLYNAATTRAKINEVLLAEQELKESQFFAIIDLDNFKLINDTFGHSYGDKVLVDVAKVLNSRFRSSDIIGRLGGDEFIVLLRNMRSNTYADGLMQELCESIHRTYRDGEKAVTISASIGVASAPKDGSTFEELYEKADRAQYEIKKDNKNGYKRY